MVSRWVVCGVVCGQCVAMSVMEEMAVAVALGGTIPSYLYVQQGVSSTEVCEGT